MAYGKSATQPRNSQRDCAASAGRNLTLPLSGAEQSNILLAPKGGDAAEKRPVLPNGSLARRKRTRLRPRYCDTARKAHCRAAPGPATCARSCPEGPGVSPDKKRGRCRNPWHHASKPEPVWPTSLCCYPRELPADSGATARPQGRQGCQAAPPLDANAMCGCCIPAWDGLVIRAHSGGGSAARRLPGRLPAGEPAATTRVYVSLAGVSDLRSRSTSNRARKPSSG